MKTEMSKISIHSNSHICRKIVHTIKKQLTLVFINISRIFQLKHKQNLAKILSTKRTKILKSEILPIWTLLQTSGQWSILQQAGVRTVAAAYTPSLHNIRVIHGGLPEISLEIKPKRYSTEYLQRATLWSIYEKLHSEIISNFDYYLYHI